jgi:hypothetical protein
MEFEGQYLTYEEYRGLGGTLDLVPFNLLEFEARRRIDIKTFDRLKKINSSQIPQEVKICEYNMIESINNYASSINSVAKGNNLKSESIDGYSVSFMTSNEISSIISSKESELDDIIRTYLLMVVVNGEHIMYCGVK